MKKIFLFAVFLCVLPIARAANVQHRYFLEGDGTVKLSGTKTGKGGTFVYRDAKGEYDLQTFDRINEVFGMKTGPDEFIHPRLIALLDYLQDRLKGGMIRIVSGYRSSGYNEGLRKKGKLAAKTSMHIEGMAADVEMDGVDGKKLWEYVRDLDCCGAGYYQGKGIHIDVGPSRFWDETSTGVEKDLGSHNKLVILRTNFDYYKKGERIYTTLGRITDYPVGIRPKVTLETPKGKSVATIELDSKDLKEKDGCVTVPDRAASRSIEFDLPEKFHSEERLGVRMEFCQKPFSEMPDSILSNVIQIRS